MALFDELQDFHAEALSTPELVDLDEHSTSILEFCENFGDDDCALLDDFSKIFDDEEEIVGCAADTSDPAVQPQDLGSLSHWDQVVSPPCQQVAPPKLFDLASLVSGKRVYNFKVPTVPVVHTSRKPGSGNECASDAPVSKQNDGDTACEQQNAPPQAATRTPSSRTTGRQHMGEGELFHFLQTGDLCVVPRLARINPVQARNNRQAAKLRLQAKRRNAKARMGNTVQYAQRSIAASKRTRKGGRFQAEPHTTFRPNKKTRRQ